MSDQQNLPEGVINANPAGGYESGDVADGETREQNLDAAASPALSESGLPSEGGDEASDPIESADATLGLDPDLNVQEES
jgi:hypothetical protein